MENVQLLWNVLWSPSKVFRRLSQQPALAAPLLTLTVFAALSALMIYFMLDPGESPRRSVWLLGLGLATIGPVFTVLLVALVFFLVFSIVGREGGYRKFLSVTAFGFMPTVFRHLAGAIMVAAIPASQLRPAQVGSFSPAAFLDPSSLSPFMYAAAARLDLVSIWVLLLLVIGYRHLARPHVQLPACAGMVAGLWVVYAALRIGVAVAVGF